MEPILTGPERAFLHASRAAVLATIGPHGTPRLVPICFALAETGDERVILYSSLDEKTKRDPDPHQLARVRDILILPEVTLLVDRWDEDWSRLAWLRLNGLGEMLEPEPRERAEHEAAIAMLRAKYPQYATHDLESRPVIRVTVHRALSWGALE